MTIFAVGLLGLLTMSILVVRAGRVLPLLVGGHFVAGAGVLLGQLPGEPQGLLGLPGAVLMEFVLGATIGAILVLTYRLQESPAWQAKLLEQQLVGLDEFALAARRRAAKRPPPAVAGDPFDIVVALVIAGLGGLAAAALTRLFPLGAGSAGDLAVLWSGVGGLLVLLAARDMLRLAAGLLLLLHATLLLDALVLGRLDAGGLLLAAATVAAALALAYLWVLGAALGHGPNLPLDAGPEEP